ncbi:MAG: zinc ribbon domain-containing protein [Bacteroidota bacterium]
MSANIQSQQALASVKQFNCPNCGNALSLLHPRAKFVACQYCGTELDASSETFHILRALVPPKKHKPYSFLELGMKGVLNGKKHQIIARSRWKMDYKEYWSDEDGSGYSDEIWYYDEWLLMAEDRTYFYLVEDREGYSISEEIIPKTPMLLPKNLRMKFYNRQAKGIVREYGKANLVYFEGETNYQIKLGDEIKFASFGKGTVYSAEWRMAENKRDIKEIEFFKENKVSRLKIAEAFRENPNVEAILIRMKKWRYVARIAGFSALASLLLFLFSMVYPGKTVFNERIPVSHIANADKETYTSPAVVLPDKGLYNLKLSCEGLPNGAYTTAFMYILDENQQAINTMGDEFYYETGRDSDGTWTESELKESKTFRLPEGGTYYFRVFVDGPQSYDTHFNLEVNKGIWISRYYLIGFIFSLMIFFVGKINGQ